MRALSRFGAITAALLGLNLAAETRAQTVNPVPLGHCAIIVASRDTLPDVRLFIEEELGGVGATVYLAANGWFAISIGNIASERAPAYLSQQKARGAIPPDSFCSSGRKLVETVATPLQGLPDLVATNPTDDQGERDLGVLPSGDAAAYLASTPFDAFRLTLEERRLLQAALALEGYYLGLYDGLWGPASQDALEAFVAETFPNEGTAGPLFAHARQLAEGGLERFETSGWRDNRLGKTGVILAAPWDLLYVTEDDPPRFAMRDQDLYIALRSSDPQTMRDLHLEMQDKDRSEAAPYLLRRDKRWVTRIKDARGWRRYLRSQYDFGVWHSVALSAAPASEVWLNAIASGIWLGETRDWEIPSEGLLRQLLDQEIQTASQGNVEEGSRETTAPRTLDVLSPATSAAEPIAFGTGFFVNNTDIVTAHHVVSDCGRITTEDDRELTLIAHDVDPDLAALSTTSQRSRVWLSMSEAAAPRLGQKIFAFGYPFYGLVGTSLHLTAGNVSSLSGPGDDDRFLSISAPIQPGNSGGPILSADGEILGVVSARLSDSFISDHTGSLPQNLNYATTLQELRRFLEEASIFFPRGEAEGYKIEEGMPARVQTAVIPILCWQ